jgi:hypothetical protein
MAAILCHFIPLGISANQEYRARFKSCQVNLIGFKAYVKYYEKIEHFIAVKNNSQHFHLATYKGIRNALDACKSFLFPLFTVFLQQLLYHLDLIKLNFILLFILSYLYIRCTLNVKKVFTCQK